MIVPLSSLIPGENILPILIVVLVLFGAQRIPQMAKSMGEGIREFKKSVNSIHDEPETPSVSVTKSED